MDLSQNILNTLERLCSLKSTSGTYEEASAALGIGSIISEIGYFKENKDNLIIHPIENDPYERKFVTALYESGKSKKTVVLLSHFDVVGIEEFGHLKEYAYSPLKYTKKLKSENIPPSAKEDLYSGDWLFGRGTMDMKCGLSIHIEIIRYLYENNIDIDGNILLLTVPDEENSSAGMLAATNYLSYLKDKGYEFQAVINSEPYFQEFPGDENRYIYTGAIGKLLPLLFFAGIETHGGEPFNGISSALLSSVTTSLIEANTKLCESYGGYTAPPPVCLKQQDIKNLYSVSTPTFSYAYYNFMTLKSSPKEVIEKLKNICIEAFNLAIDKINNESLKYSSISGKKSERLDVKPNVLSFDELCGIVEKKGIDVEKIKMNYRDSNLDTRDMTAYIILDILKCVPELRPAIIVALSPPYYPHRFADEKFKNVLDVCKCVIERSNKVHGQNLIHRNFFPGLCDLSYLGFENPKNYYILKSNMPVMDIGYKLPVESLSNIDIGGINIGVFGRDVHKYTERLNMPYSFKITPDLVLFAIKKFLQ